LKGAFHDCLDELEDSCGWNVHSTLVVRSIFLAVIGRIQKGLGEFKNDVNHFSWRLLFQLIECVENFVFYSPVETLPPPPTGVFDTIKHTLKRHQISDKSIGAPRDPKVRHFTSIGLHVHGSACLDLPLVKAIHKIWTTLQVGRNLLEETYVDTDDREMCKLLKKKSEADRMSLTVPHLSRPLCARL
jgi:hypothetical protein